MTSIQKRGRGQLGSQRPQKEAQAWALRPVTGSSPLSETLRPQLSEGPGPTDLGWAGRGRPERALSKQPGLRIRSSR